MLMQIWYYTDSKSVIVKKLDENEDAVIWNYRKSQKLILAMKKLLKHTQSLNTTGSWKQDRKLQIF